MKKKEEKRTRTFMYVCNLDQLPSTLKTDSDAVLARFLSEHLPDGSMWAWIVHDKDVFSEEDENRAGEPKAAHLHIAIYLPNAKTPTAVAKMLGEDRPQNVQKFTGKNARQNCFSYLVHRTETSKADGKHVYPYSEIHSNFNYEAFVEGAKNSIEASKYERSEVMQMIMKGELRFIDFVMSEPWTSFYLENKTFVSAAIDTLYKRRMNEANREKVLVLYIYGPAGSGKTTYAKHYALKNYRDYCVSSSGNDAVQDYLGQDVMIFDDARPSDFSPSDWLKLLDPYNNQASINSRYYNKYLAVKCIILTSVVKFENFFVESLKNFYGDNNEMITAEPIDQFMRRFSYVLTVTGHDNPFEKYCTVDVSRVEMTGSYDFREYSVGNLVLTYRVVPTGKSSQLLICKKNENEDAKYLDTF